MQEITVRELNQLRDKDPGLYLLDVREQEEWDIAHIKGAHLMPLSTFEDSYQEIPKDKTVYCLCKMGGRSAHAVQFLQAKGYTHVVNVNGGIQAWSQEIDTSLAHY